MSDYAPPSGPPPTQAPQVPAGWKAIWNAQYSEWFYVNTFTKQSQWDKPTEPAHDPNALNAPTGPPPSHSPNPAASSDMPPSYSAGSTAPANAGSDIKRPLSSNNPYSSNTAESDEAMARRLQEQENARHTSAGPGHATDRGASDGYYNDPNAYPSGPTYGQQSQQQYGQQSYGQQQYGQQSQQPMSAGGDQSRGKSGGFFSKLKDKIAAPPGGSRPMGAPMMGYGAGGYPSQQHGYGGYPQQGYGGYPQQGYGGYPQQGYGGYGQPMMMQKKKHGMGAGGAAALGVGGGLLGGMLLADGINDMQEDAYDQGYDDGGGDMGDMGGDF